MCIESEDGKPQTEGGERKEEAVRKNGSKADTEERMRDSK